MECDLVWNHRHDFKIERALRASSIWNHKYDFGPKLHSTQFNYQLIISILKSLLKFHFSWATICSKDSSKFSLSCHMSTSFFPALRLAISAFSSLWLVVQKSAITDIKLCNYRLKKVRLMLQTWCQEPIKLQESLLISKWI